MDKKKAFIAMLTITVLVVPIFNACVETEKLAKVIPEVTLPEEVIEKGPIIVSVVPTANTQFLRSTLVRSRSKDKAIENIPILF